MATGSPLRESMEVSYQNCTLLYLNWCNFYRENPIWIEAKLSLTELKTWLLEIMLCSNPDIDLNHPSMAVNSFNMNMRELLVLILVELDNNNTIQDLELNSQAVPDITEPQPAMLHTWVLNLSQHKLM